MDSLVIIFVILDSLVDISGYVQKIRLPNLRVNTSRQRESSLSSYLQHHITYIYGRNPSLSISDASAREDSPYNVP